MKKVAAFVALVSFATAVWAACPAGTVYRCFSTPSGKMMCGCY